MSRAHFQNRVAESVFTLPTCIVVSALLWWIGGITPLHVGAWMVCLSTAYLLTEMDNVVQLIRLRTRLVPCFWLFASSCLAFLHPLLEVQLPACAMAASCFFLLRCHQRFQPVGSVFHCFLILSAGSLIFPHMLLLSIPFYVCLQLFMCVRTWRTLWAALIGLLLPYVAWILWGMWKDNLHPLATHFLQLASLPPPESWQSLPAVHLVSAVLLVVLLTVSVAYYAATSFSDKIRVRMLFSTFIVLCLCVVAGMVLLPARLVTLMALLLVASSPLVARLFTLTHSRWSNGFFLLVLVTFLALAAWIRLEAP